MDWATIAAAAASVIAALGGQELLKWWFNRKTYARKEALNVRESEIAMYEKQIDRYEARLAQRDQKVDTLYKELRNTQDKVATLTYELNEAKLDARLNEIRRCDVRGCANRKPPSDF